jgi:hypothetical protein
MDYSVFINGSIGNSLKPYSGYNNKESFHNAIKVSLTSNPFTFPYANTYQIGNSEIVAMMSNSIAVGSGQTGAAPLYVFCKDGIYALMVDSSGELAYTNARIIARDVCKNAKSVTPIDSGVVFTTDRGLMSISGNEVIELGQIVEGDVFDITDNGNTFDEQYQDTDKAKKIMFNAFHHEKLGNIHHTLVDNKDFLTYIKGAIINYNHNERELMVSNSSFPYSYVMDRHSNWTRRNYKADEYVNNYPTSYRVIDKKFYKVDQDNDSVTSNNAYLLSHVVKLDTISFKQAYRIAVRGYFEILNTENKLGLYVFGSNDGIQWAMLGGKEEGGKFTDIGCKISHTDIKFLRICLAGQLSKKSRIDFVEIEYDDSALSTKIR